MPATTPTDEELGLVLSAAIVMCRDQMDLALERRARVADAYELCQADLEFTNWRRALTDLLEAERLRGG